MTMRGLQEFTVGNCLVRVYAAPISLPGVEGWVGVWSIYALPRGTKAPIRIGDTGVETSEAVALGMAKAMASAAASAL